MNQARVLKRIEELEQFMEVCSYGSAEIMELNQLKNELDKPVNPDFIDDDDSLSGVKGYVIE